MLSEITFSALLMMISYGWTLTFNDLDIDNNLDIYLPVGSIVIVVHLVLAAMTYVDFDAHHKYHDFAGVQGWVLIVFKLGLFAYYLYCIRSNRDKIPRRSEKFFKSFTILGTMYMLSVPFTIFASYFFQPYNRQYIFTLTTNFVQLISTALMIYQQSSTQSHYFKASLNAQGILPTGKLA
jgi:Rhodopsin-like GPCR transmembrane domain